MNVEPSVAFERAKRGGEAVLSLYGAAHFGAISRGRKPIRRFIPKGVAGRRPANRTGQAITDVEGSESQSPEMRRPGLALEDGPGPCAHLVEETIEMVTETATPTDVGKFHYYAIRDIGRKAWRVYRDSVALGVVERHKDGFGATTQNQKMAAGGLKSRREAAQWLFARAEAGA